MKLFTAVFVLLGSLAPLHAGETGVEARITTALSALGYAQIQVGVSEGSVSASAVRQGRTTPSCFELIGNRLVEGRCPPPRLSASPDAQGQGMQDDRPNAAGVEVEDLNFDTPTDEGPDVVEIGM